MQKNQTYEARIGLQAAAHEFGRRHRIRLQLAGSSFPRFERNLHTGGRNFDECDGVVAWSDVHHSTAHPSHLILPILTD
jgi:predicted acyl esterase